MTARKILKAVGEIEDLVIKEGLHSQLGDLYGMVADILMERLATLGRIISNKKGMGDEEEQAELVLLATELAKKSVRRKKHFAGVDSGRTAAALEKLERLEKLGRGGSSS